MGQSRLVSILLADSDGDRAGALSASLENAGFQVDRAVDSFSVQARLREGGLSVVLTDVAMDAGDALQILRLVRGYDLDLGVVVLCESNQDGLAGVALENGALAVLTRPFRLERLVDMLSRAAGLLDLARARRELLKAGGPNWSHLGDRCALEQVFDRASAELAIAFQPIISWSKRRVIGHEALLRSANPNLPDPASVLAVAERLGRVEEIGRIVRDRVASQVRRAPAELVFVNLHPEELLDEALYSTTAPLSQHGRRVVLELSEPMFPPGLPYLENRVASLRALGYRFALKNLGPGHVGLGVWARLRPDFAVLDGTLVRALAGDIARGHAMAAMVRHLTELGVRVIAAGIETLAERDAMIASSVDLLQGFAFSPPATDYREPSIT